MRYIRLVLLVCVFTLLFSSVALADTSEIEERFNISSLLESVDSAATVVITTIRTVTAVLTVVLLASVGFTLWRAQDGQTLEMVKTRIYFIFAGLFVIFLTEPIVNFVRGIVGD